MQAPIQPVVIVRRTCLPGRDITVPGERRRSAARPLSADFRRPFGCVARVGCQRLARPRVARIGELVNAIGLTPALSRAGRDVRPPVVREATRPASAAAAC